MTNSPNWFRTPRKPQPMATCAACLTLLAVAWSHSGLTIVHPSAGTQATDQTTDQATHWATVGNSMASGPRAPLSASSGSLDIAVTAVMQSPDEPPQLDHPEHPVAQNSRIRTGIQTPASSTHESVATQPIGKPPGIAVDPTLFVDQDTTDMAFSRVLHTDTFVRPHWRSFQHIAPTPPSVAAHTTESRSEDRFVVMLDPGHGGTDVGAIGANGLQEKHLTLDIARRVALFLSEIDDIDVVMTRYDDSGLSRHNRVSAIQRAGADLVLSLHFNDLPQTNVNLVETFYAGPQNIRESLKIQRAGATTAEGRQQIAQSPDMSFTQQSRRFASIMQQRLHSELSDTHDDAGNAGVKHETLYVLTRSFIPGVLAEISCLSNPAEAERLTDESYRNRLAAALADGIREFHAGERANPPDQLALVTTR